MRFSSLLDRQERGEITHEEAAEMLGVRSTGFGDCAIPSDWEAMLASTFKEMSGKRLMGWPFLAPNPKDGTAGWRGQGG
jgi:hypothetical protein